MKINYEYLLSVSPEKAVEYLQSKGYKLSRDWREVWKDANKRAFTITKIMKQDILKDVKESIIRSIEEGKGYDTFKREVEKSMELKGWTTNPWRLKTIYRTNLDVAYSVGRFREQWSVKHSVPYWQYITANDDKVRPSHAAFHNKIFLATDPIWKIIYPPNGFNCRCKVITHTRKEYRKLKEKGFQVEKSKDRLKEVEVEIGPIGNKTKVKVHTFDGHLIDPGWDYNPALKDNYK
jgi:SPP1 gp7 family putative phage head morphogenesis protein